MDWDGTERRSRPKRRSGNWATIGFFPNEVRGHRIDVPERREFADRRGQIIEEWEGVKCQHNQKTADELRTFLESKIWLPEKISVWLPEVIIEFLYGNKRY